MAYDLSLDKKTIVVLLSGLGLVGVLLFFLGFLVGVSVGLPRLPVAQVSKAPAPPAAPKLPAVQVPKAPAPAAPVKAVDQATAQPAGQAAPPPPASPPASPVISGSAPSTASAATAASQSSLAKAAPQTPASANATAQASLPAAATPAAAPSASPPAQPAATASSEASAGLGSNAAAVQPGSCVTLTKSPPPVASGQRVYSIQMGAFLDANNASRMVTELKARGCDATVFQAVDSHGRLWSAVRIGPFGGLQAASQAAAEFKRNEGMFALVRPADSL
jgi:cell division septation protein DedD